MRIGFFLELPGKESIKSGDAVAGIHSAGALTGAAQIDSVHTNAAHVNWIHRDLCRRKQSRGLMHSKVESAGIAVLCAHQWIGTKAERKRYRKPQEIFAAGIPAQHACQLRHRFKSYSYPLRGCSPLLLGKGVPQLLGSLGQSI